MKTKSPLSTQLRKAVFGGSLYFAAMLLASGAFPAAARAEEPSRLKTLEILSGGYPRAIFFRLSEDLARGNRLPYDEWEKTFLPLGGVALKALDEEIPGPNGAIIEYASRFKQRHPEKLVLLHYNNGGRDPHDGDQHVMRHPSVRPYQAPLCNLMWAYNFSSRCPRDAQGRQCSDILADDLAAEFLPGGRLALFDGVEFDVPVDKFAVSLAAQYSMLGKGKRRGDLDADGSGDDGIFDGVNTYSMGLYHFYKRLRQRLGEDRLIMADGGNLNQHCYGVLNGIEVEGFGSSQSKSVARDWSESMNRFRAWRQFGRSPAFSYINHKEYGGRWDDVPFHFHRYVMATAVMCDAAMTHYASVKAEPGELYGGCSTNSKRERNASMAGWDNRGEKPSGLPAALPTCWGTSKVSSPRNCCGALCR